MRKDYTRIFIIWICIVFYALPVYCQEICDNEIDDDGDGLIDCYDDDCSGITPCEEFFFGQPSPDCEFSPPPIQQIELTELYRTDHVAYPIDQRSGVYVGDMNGDGIPDLVTRDNNPARIQIYSGDDGTILQSIPTGGSHPFGQVAIADVDRNGLGDIFHVEYDRRLARYEFGNPNPVWQTPNGQTNDTSVGTPQIADLNGDGIPEVYVGGRIFDSETGILYSTESVNNGGYAGGSNSDRFPIVYDFFQEGDPIPGGGGAVFGPEANGLEYAAGDRIYTFDFTPGVAGSGDFMQASMLNDSDGTTGDGFSSISDINGDGIMDVAVMDGGRVYAWDPYTGQRIGSIFNIPNTSSGGRINIGDFNGDGDVELGFAGRNAYYVLQLEADNTFSVLWSRSGLDDGSQRTGSTLFDFDGDGMNEVVYSEEANLFVYSGIDGAELLRIPSEAGTRTEYPLVADVNGDGTAEIIVTAQDGNGPGFSGSGWVTVYTSANQPWVPTRPVWNQHGYNVVNVNDDLTIPAIQQDPLNPALIDNYNNFLVQSPVRTQSGVGNFPAADATLEAIIDPMTNEPVRDFTDCPEFVSILLEVENAGAAILPGTTPVAFYEGDPTQTQAVLIDVITLGEDVNPGESIMISLAVSVIDYAGQDGPNNVFMVVNDAGFDQADLPFDFATDFPVTGTAECDYTNNLSMIGSLNCEEICDGNGTDDGIDNDGDNLIDEPNIFAPTLTGCPGEELPQFTTDVGNNNGTYSVVQPDPTGTTVTADGQVTLGDNVATYPTTVDIQFDDGNCIDIVTVMIDDTEAPQIVCPGNRTQPVDDNCTSITPDLLSGLQSSDDCAATSDLTLTQLPAAGDPLVLGDNTITITATDLAGNSANCTTTITTLDQSPPLLSCVNSLDIMADAQCRGLIPDLSSQTNAVDNCTDFGDLIFTQVPAVGTLVNSNASNFVQTVQLNVRDESNNQSTCSINVRILDQTPPDVVCPANQTINLNQNCVAQLPDYRDQVTKSDNCSNGAQIQTFQNPSPGLNITMPGVTMVTITARDQANNVNNTGCTFSVTVVDQTPPTLSCPSVIMADADANDCSVTVGDYTGVVQANDNCGTAGTITITQSPIAGSAFNADQQIVTITADDGSNTVTCDITIQRQDITPPSISCPADQTESVDASCQFTLTDYSGLATAGDNCTATLLVTQSPAPGTIISSDQTITLTATDEAGNSASCTFMVLLEDNTPPIITCPADQDLGVDMTCDVPLPDYTNNGSLQDNCSAGMAVSVTQSPAPGTPVSGPNSTINVSLTPTDEAGNVGLPCTFVVTLVDMQAPSITCPASPQTDFVDVNCSALVPDFRDDTDVSSMCDMGGISLTQSPPPGTMITASDLGPAGLTTVITITADDGNGNTASCSFDYVILDNTPPNLTCPADLTVDVDANCSYTLADLTTQTLTNDNCGMMITLSQTPAAATAISGDGTTQTVTISGTDAAGNAAMCLVNVTLEDNIDPVVTCPVVVAPLVANADCTASLPDYTMNSSATDNCSGPGEISLTQSPAPATVISGAGTTQSVTITATDENNNIDQCVITVVLEDQADPVIDCPADQILVVDGNCEATVPNLASQATVSDNCTLSAQITVSQDVAPNTVLSNDGTIQTVVLTADDGNGNTANCSVQLTLEDNSPPIVTCPLAQELVLDAGCMAVLPDYSGQLSASDNCTDVASLTITQSPPAGSTVSGANTIVAVTFTVDDNNGNATTCQFNVTLTDESDPTVVCPANQVLNLDSDCQVEIPDFTGSATPADGCTMSGMIELIQSPGLGTVLAGHNQQQTVTITANDGNGNLANCSFTVSTADVTPPSIACPADLTVAVDNNCAFNLPDYRANATTADNCSEVVDIMLVQSPIGTALTSLNTPETITITATDQAGNSANCTFTVTPTDQTNPDIVCPAPQVIYLDGACSVNLPDFTALGTPTDNCTDEASIMVTQNPAENTNYVSLDSSIIMVTLTATDASGNTGTCSFQVDLQDTIRPTVICPVDTVIALDEDCNGEIPDRTGVVMADDNCSGSALTIIQSPEPGTTYSGDGTNVEVTYTITDSDGNQTTCTSLVTFEDQSPPDPVTCPDNQTLTTDDSCPIALPDYSDNVTVLDNCRAQEEIILTQAPSPGMTFMNNGTVVTVTITADDGNGNTEDCVFDVTLVDNVPLNLTCPGGQIVIASNDDCTGTLLDYSDQAEVSNECMSPAAGVTFVQTPMAGTILPSAQLNVPQTVTLNAEDANGNITSCDFLVTLIDTLPPVLTCPIDTVKPVDAACQYYLDDFRDQALVEDNCSPVGSIVLTQSPAENAPVQGPDGNQEVTITAEDADGNISNCVFMVTVQDTFPPNLQCPAPDTLFVNGDCEAVIPDYRSEAEKLDNCTAQGDVVITQSPAPGTVLSGDDTDQLITIEATDGSGNTSSCTFEINLQDTIRPDIICPGMQVINPDENCDALIGDYRGLATTMDNCATGGMITVSQLPAPGTILNGQGAANLITLTADDGNGNSTDCTLEVELVDNVPPQIACPPDTTVDLDGDCEYDLPDLRPMVNATDNCTAQMDIVLTQQPGIGATFSGHLTSIEAVVTADDGNGNQSQCSFNITLEDNTPPTIECPLLQIIVADDNCMGLIPDYTSLAQVDDNCTAIDLIRISQMPAPGTIITGDGTAEEITLTADDGNGNTVSCSFFARLEDQTPPSIACPADQVIFTDENCSVDLPDYTDLVMVSDNCTGAGMIAVDQIPSAGTTFSELGVNTLTLTADDGNGNTADCSFTVIVADNTPPELVCPPLSVVAGDESCIVSIADYRDSISVSDNCTATLSVNLTQTAPPGTMISGLGTSEELTITATDESGNSSNCIITVEVTDLTPPTISCPNDTTLATDANCTALVPDYTGLPEISDNCTEEGSLTVTQSPAAGSTLSEAGTITEITLTVTDENNNATSCTFEVTLIDTIDPVVICPANDTISVDGVCVINLNDYTGAAQSMDNCSDPTAMIITQMPAAGLELSGDGTTQEVMIMAEDESGNTTECVFTVVLEDTTEPMINCPADQELTADDDCTVPIPDYTGDATTSSSCDQGNMITVTQVPAPGTLISGHLATETITLTATDGSGNSVNCSFIVTPFDRTAPTIVDCPADQTEAVDAGCAFTIPDYWVTTPASADDNCRPTGTTATTATGDQIVYTQFPLPGTVLNGAFTSQTITLTANDGNGNVVSCAFELSLEDTTSPIIPVCAIDTIANPDASCTFTIEDYRNRIAPIDNCTDADDLVVMQAPPAGTQINGQGAVQEITLTVTDASGNMTTCSFELSLQDTISPSVECPENKVELIDGNCAFELPDYTSEATSNDNCSAMTTTVGQQPAPGTIFANEGTIIPVTLTADDGNGNTTSCTFEVRLDDVIPPVIDCPNDTTIFLDEVCAGTLPDLVPLTTAADNCAPAVSGNPILISQQPLAGTTYTGEGTSIDATLTADDQNGNTVNCVVTVSFRDTVRPMIVCPANDTIFTDSDCMAAIPDYRVQAVAMDNCTTSENITISQLAAPGTILDSDETLETITLTADDGNGNTRSCNFTVRLLDDDPPSIVCPPTQTQFADANCEVMVGDYTGLAVVEDNCTPNFGGNLVITQAPTLGSSFVGVQNQTVTLTADDGNGDTTNCAFQLEIRDNVEPMLTCPPTQTELSDATCIVTIGDYIGLAQASDNCVPPNTATSLVLTQNPAAGFTFSGFEESLDVTITATDSTGNSTFCVFTVELGDAIDPTVSCPPAQEIFGDELCAATLPDYRDLAIAEDNCDNAVTELTYVQSPAAGLPLNGANTSQTVTIEVTDRSGNNVSCDFVVTLRDTVSPTITCPPRDTLSVDGMCPVDLPDYTDNATVADNCTDETAIVVSQLPSAGTVFMNNPPDPNMIVVVTLTADDGNGNTSACDFEVELIDQTDPTIVCPGRQTLTADGSCEADVPDYTPLANTSSTCGDMSNLTITQTPAAGTVTLMGDSSTQLITLRVTDGSGNFAECTFDVILLDDTAPTIDVCPPDVTVFVDDNCETILEDYRPELTTSDNCEVQADMLITQSPEPGTIFSGGATQVAVLFTVDDRNGNATDCSATITLSDTIRPTIDCPANDTIFTDANCDAMIPDYTDATIMDNCSPIPDISIIQNPVPGTPISGQGSTRLVTLTIEDGFGNVNDCSLTVTLLDDDPPSIICPPSTTIDSGVDCGFTLPDYTSLGTADDNCASNLLTIVQSPDPDTLLTELNTTVEVTLTVTDGNNNQAECSFFVTTASATPPPPQLTVTLEEIPDETGGATATFNLNDALDPMAESNTTDADLDNDLQAGPGPYLVTFYESLADAEAETDAIIDPANYESADGGALIARLEDPSTGCFVLSQVLLTVRPQGTSDVVGEVTFCNKGPFILTLQGNALPASQSTTVTYQWTIVNPGPTGIQENDLLNPMQENLQIDTEGLNSGTLILQFQFFEDYGNGPVVPSVPALVEIELTNVGAGSFFWDGND
ncbi:hypothetical protein CEQ90_08110 [Lewinellaceae bacterium SD302]|nr:hypothetical protein CEQ90_08110 [Lewinellaceae bacterium SD302]